MYVARILQAQMKIESIGMTNHTHRENGIRRTLFSPIRPYDFTDFTVHNPLISRVCTLLHVNGNFFCAATRLHRSTDLYPLALSPAKPSPLFLPPPVSSVVNSHRRHLSGLLVLLILAFPLSAAEGARYALYRSEDRGRSWSRSDSGLSGDSRINALSAIKNSIVAGTDSGLFISGDSGQTWQKPTITGTNAARVTSVAVVSNYIFAGTIEGRLLSSSDQGQTWLVNPAFPPRNIRSLHSFQESLYVGTDADHVYQSSDLGKTWTHITAGLPSPCQVFSLASVDGKVFAGLYAQGLYSLNATEQKWSRVGQSTGIRPLALAVVGQTLIAGHNPGGIHSSDDLGHTWQHWVVNTSSTRAADNTASGFFDPLSNLQNDNSDLPQPLQAAIWEMSADSSLAIAGAGNSIYYSTDRARTWTRATTGLPANSAGIAFLLKPNLILAAIYQKTSNCDESKIK